MWEREFEIWRANELDGSSFEHGIMLFTDKTSIFDGFGKDIWAGFRI
jgi:hypothetical protein